MNIYTHRKNYRYIITCIGHIVWGTADCWLSEPVSIESCWCQSSHWCSVLGFFSPFLNPKHLRNSSETLILFFVIILNKPNPKSHCPTPSPPPPSPNPYEYCLWTWVFVKIKTWDSEVMRSKRLQKAPNVAKLQGENVLSKASGLLDRFL